MVSLLSLKELSIMHVTASVFAELEDALGLKLPNRVTIENECSKRKVSAPKHQASSHICMQDKVFFH